MAFPVGQFMAEFVPGGSSRFLPDDYIEVWADQEYFSFTLAELKQLVEYAEIQTRLHAKPEGV